MQHVNVGRIISQEIVNYPQKNEGMLYFPCPISGLCKKQLVPHDGKDETLMKGNIGRKPRLQLPAAEAKVPASSSPDVMAILSKMQKDAQIFYAWNDKLTG
jgi:hypothetical protein